MRRTAALSGLILVAACSSQKPGPPAAHNDIQVVQGAPKATPTGRPNGSCDTTGLRNVVGQSYTDVIAQQARQSSKATALATLGPGEATPQPANGNRLLLTLNGNGTITDARCG